MVRCRFANQPSFNISITDVTIELSILPFNLPTSEIIKLLFAVKSFPGRAKLVTRKEPV